MTDGEGLYSADYEGSTLTAGASSMAVDLETSVDATDDYVDHAVIADDDATLRFLVRNFVDRVLPGLQHSEHEDGEPALERLSGLAASPRDRVEFIYSDQMMLRFHGTDLYKGVRRNPALQKTPFLMASGGMPAHLREELRAHTEGDPFFRFLDKPFTMGEFNEAVSALVSTRKRVEQVEGGGDENLKIMDRFDI